MDLNDAARTLIGAGTDATLVTINDDGSPQVSVVWFALQSTPEGDELVSAHLSGNYKKLRNIRRDPHVAVTILAPSQPGQQRAYLSVTGSARVVEGGAPELLKQLATTMLGSDEHFPPPNAPDGYLTRIRIESVGGNGPWAPQP
ncbi:PPOX class F420-dependent oxidoreductase [Mycobacteroides salmoniphilum]|uniref:PPOX class F420-dependent oxidoreductase n=1 Tax=Mycobacteroides salmoniphilum TaxID=404941 RepID=UPI000991AB31|nr:PPOX class F420-dependent oxidoreductase [Mycobacteroides salmoniphilum]QCH24363.1 Pyridoxamine 5'-phosphate oxidase [Mycobacteroides salmoniphilum]